MLQLVEYRAQLLFLAFGSRRRVGIVVRPVDTAYRSEPHCPHLMLGRRIGIDTVREKRESDYEQ